MSREAESHRDRSAKQDIFTPLKTRRMTASDSKVALVSGSNKGLGLELVRRLANAFPGLVYLTARDEGRGRAALEGLRAELSPEEAAKLRFHQLDIANKESIDRMRDHLATAHGRLDLLINNAGMAFKASSTAPFAEQARVTVETNYFGTRAVCAALFPLLSSDARVVNVASRGGTIAMRRMGDGMRGELGRAETEDDVDELMRTFVRLAQEGKEEEAGFPHTSLGMSKLGLIALSERQGKRLAALGTGILLNACCPGHMKTDMSSHQGTVSPSEGAETPLWLALLPAGTEAPSAQFVAEKAPIDWRKGQTIDQFPGFPKNYFSKK